MIERHGELLAHLEDLLETLQRHHDHRRVAQQVAQHLHAPRADQADDLLVAPDFLRLFWSAAWLLRADPSLWCVSAWNDNAANLARLGNRDVVTRYNLRGVIEGARQVTKLTTGARQLQVVFPVPGFVFGRASQAWLQVLVIDEGARARGVREVGYVLDVLVNGTHVHSVRGANGRRIYVPAARPGAADRRLAQPSALFDARLPDNHNDYMLTNHYN